MPRTSRKESQAQTRARLRSAARGEFARRGIAAASIDRISEAAGYSRRHLERLFRDTTGQTPGEFYRGLRLDRGRNLLATTDLTLIEIATACGFDSVSHFSKSFRARFGVPPTKLKHGIGRARP